MPWPPQIQDVKADLGRDTADSRDDAVLQTELDAAVAFVERQRRGDFNFTGATTGADALLPAPTPALVLGTVRLTIRWHTLRRSPDGLVDAGDLGTVRVPRIGADLEALLGIGSYREPMV